MDSFNPDDVAIRSGHFIGGKLGGNDGRWRPRPAHASQAWQGFQPVTADCAAQRPQNEWFVSQAARESGTSMFLR